MQIHVHTNMHRLHFTSLFNLYIYIYIYLLEDCVQDRAELIDAKIRSIIITIQESSQ